MNNLQLALILSGYAKELTHIFGKLTEVLDKIDGTPKVKIEKRGKWIGEGEAPILDLIPRRENYEWYIEEGTPICLTELEYFLGDLWKVIEKLSNDE